MTLQLQAVCKNRILVFLTQKQEKKNKGVCQRGQMILLVLDFAQCVDAFSLFFNQKKKKSSPFKNMLV